MILTKTTLAFVAISIALATAIAPLFLNQASAKITEDVVIEQSCTNRGGNQAGGQQPECNNPDAQEQTTVTENQNPSGSAPPGQNK
jgi:hypothetical protein